MDNPIPVDLRRDFYQSQYNALRREIEINLTDARAVERNAAIATAAVWAWLSTHTLSSEYRWCWFIPVIFTILGFLRHRALSASVSLIGSYLRYFESKVTANEIQGWETGLRAMDKPHYVSRTRDKWWDNAMVKQHHSITNSSMAFWLILFALTLGIGFVGYHSQVKEAAKATAAPCK